MCTPPLFPLLEKVVWGEEGGGKRHRITFSFLLRGRLSKKKRRSEERRHTKKVAKSASASRDV